MNLARFRRTLVLTALAAALPAAVQALDPAKSIYQYNCQNWTRAAGLPADKIGGIAQTPDGYLWLGGQNGLIRYDGAEFKVVPIDLPEAQGQDVRRVSTGVDGKLWFSIAGGGYGAYDGSKFYPIDDARWTAPGANSDTILAAHDGSIWTGSVVGWGHWVPGNPAETRFDETVGAVINIMEDATGRIWMGTAERGLLYWEKGELKRFPDPDLHHRNIHSVALDRSGDLWVGTDLGLFQYDSGYRRKNVHFQNVQTNDLLLDRHGVLWAGTSDLGLARIVNGKPSLLQKVDGLGSNYVISLYEDAEGSLWVGTIEGISQLTDLKFPIFSSKEGLVPGGTVSVGASAKGVWVVTSAGASLLAGDTVTNFTEPALFPNRYVRRVFEARNGDVYFVDGNKNICVLRDGLPAERYNIDQWPEAFAEDAEGILVGIGPSLYRVRDRKIQPYVFVGEEPRVDWYNHLLVAKDGAIWAGTNNGVYRFQAGKVQQWSTKEGLTSNRIHFLHQAEDGSIWGGTPTGLVRIKNGTAATVSADQGLLDARIYAIVPDDFGNFWMASGNGLLRAPEADLNAVIEKPGNRLRCDQFDGLESLKFIDRTDQAFAGCRTKDGRIWFPSPQGAVMVDPKNYFVNKVPPRVYIEKVSVKGRDVSAARDSVLKVGDRTIEFFFTALSFISPKKMLLRYKLEGWDGEWIDASHHRSVLYNNLPAGRYTFRVQAANADGIWNTTGDSFTVELPPPYYQRTWFYLVCATGLILVLFGTYRWKVRNIQAVQRRLKHENDRLEANVAKRTEELAKSVSLLNATLESIADGIVAIDRSGKVISYNTKFIDIWNFPPDLLASRDAAQLRAFSAQHVADAYVDRFVHRAAENVIPANTDSFDVIELKDGRIFERYFAPQRIDGEQVGVVINWRDVTQRRRAETAAAEASALLEALMKNTADFIYFKDRECRFVRYSDVMGQRFCPSAPGSLVGKTDLDLHTASLAAATQHDEQEIMRTGQPVIGKLESDKLPDGRKSWVLTTKMPWRAPDGEIIGTFGITRDVTAIKEAEEKLAYERDLLRSLLDSSPDQIYFKDLGSRFVKCSKAQAQNFHVPSPEDLVGKSDFDFFTEAHARSAFEDEQRIIATGEPVLDKVEQELWQDGRVTWVMTNKMPLRDSQGTIIGTVGNSKDITALKQAEAQLEQAHQQLVETSRQAGMAEVATSVLHNVGNVLNSVNVSATLVAEQVRDSKIAYVAKVADLLNARANDLAAFLTQDPKGQKVTAYLASLSGELVLEQRKMIEELGHLRKNVEHIKEIVAMQQNFAKVSGVTESLPITELIEDALRINSSSLTRHEVELVRDFRAQPNLVIERHKVMQILVNLIRNAKYACDESGQPNKRIIVRVTATADRAIISVIDNGVGIPQENLTRIFAHGFTTKKEGHGFGLHSGALAAKELGGTLIAQSEGRGLGATFLLELPLSRPTA